MIDGSMSGFVLEVFAGIIGGGEWMYRFLPLV